MKSAKPISNPFEEEGWACVQNTRNIHNQRSYGNIYKRFKLHGQRKRKQISKFSSNIQPLPRKWDCTQPPSLTTRGTRNSKWPALDQQRSGSKLIDNHVNLVMGTEVETGPSIPYLESVSGSFWSFTFTGTEPLIALITNRDGNRVKNRVIFIF